MGLQDRDYMHERHCRVLGSSAVMKCHGAGGTSYSDGLCPPGTRATRVILPV